MIRAPRIFTGMPILGFFGLLAATFAAPAAAGSVGVTITLLETPEGLLYVPAIPPREVRICLARQRAIETYWKGTGRPPRLACLSGAGGALVVDDAESRSIVIRP